MGIRGKLLLLAAGIAVPLVVVGALDLRNMWQLSRSQLNDSVKQQVELASVALERWLDDQKKALDAIAALAGDNDTSTPAVRENLEHVLQTRPFWRDLRITNSAGTTIMSQPSRREVLPNALTDFLASEMRKRNTWTVVTDRTVDEARPIVIIAVPIRKAGAVIAQIDGAVINQLFDSIQLSPQVVISVLDKNGRVLYRRRGSEAPSESDASWPPLSSVLTEQRTNVVELISPIDGVRRVYGVAHVRETGLVAAISVSDTGEGIPEAALPHIFEKFYRAGSETPEDETGASIGTAAPGVGLGLYLAQHIVGQLDGKLTVESKPGGGTTFTLLLPRWSDSSDSERSEQNAGVKALVGS